MMDKPPQEFIDNWSKVFDKRPKDALKPVWKDLWFLHNWVKDRKPETVLEFGSGCSTVIMAYTLWYSHIYSAENDERWLIETMKMMPSYFWARLTLFYSPVRKVDFQGLSAFSYDYSCPVCPDFIYLDGPELTDDCRVTISPLEVEASFPKGFSMIVDGRQETVAFLRENLKREYRFTHIDDSDNGISVFELIK